LSNDEVKPLNVLAADTATGVLTVALCAGSPGHPESTQTLAESTVFGPRRHAEEILPTVQTVLAQAQWPMASVDAFAISIGPGSFTGIRIGVATWKGLAYAAGKPLWGVSTLAALSRAAEAARAPVCTLLDARMQEVYSAAYRYQSDGGRAMILREAVEPVEAFFENLHTAGVTDPPVLIGDGVAVYADRIADCCQRYKWHNAGLASGQVHGPRASLVAAEAFAAMQFKNDRAADPGLVEPVYLRVSQAEMKRAESSATVAAP